MYKLIVSDFDGTLLDNDGGIPITTVSAIDQIRRKDISFAIATGRTLDSILSYNRDYNFIDYIIALNGSYIYDVDLEKVLFSKSMKSTVIKKIFDVYKDKEIMYFCTPNKWNLYFSEVSMNVVVNSEESSFTNYSEFMKENRTNIYKLEIYFKNQTKAKKALKELKQLELDITTNLQMNPGDAYLIEITSGGVDKYQGIKKVAKKLKISDEEIIAIGDGHNDIPMVRKAGLGVAVGNAVSELKKCAKVITDSNINKGVEKFIETLNQ